MTLPDDDTSFKPFCDIEQFLGELVDNEDATYTKGEVEEIDGEETIEIVSDRPEEGTSSGYVLTEGDHYLVRISKTEGADPGEVTFSGFDERRTSRRPPRTSRSASRTWRPATTERSQAARRAAAGSPTPSRRSTPDSVSKSSSTAATVDGLLLLAEVHETVSPPRRIVNTRVSSSAVHTAYAGAVRSGCSRAQRGQPPVDRQHPLAAR